jgi:hypothetical protein
MRKGRLGAPMGRPSDYTEELADAICDRIAGGESLKAICNDPKMPGKTAVFKWLGVHKDFAEKYARARETQADAIFDEVLDIADDSDLDPQDRRVKIDARKWMAGKLRPKIYGDKLDVAHSGGISINVIDSFADNPE